MAGIHKTVVKACAAAHPPPLIKWVGLRAAPWVVVSIKQGGADQEVAVLAEGTHGWAHLALVPNCWSLRVILIPWTHHLVGIFPYKGVGLHGKS